MYEPGIILRKPREEDVKALANLILRFYRFNEEFDPAWALHKEAEEKAVETAQRYVQGDGYTIVAAYESEIVGYAHGQAAEYPLLENSRQLVIRELYVKPQYRGRGIATMLVEKMIEIAKEDGISVVTAMFPTANFVAERFYKSRKFRPYICLYLKEV